jgi:hypothetical protein
VFLTVMQVGHSNFLSGRLDLNQRPLSPEPSALPTAPRPESQAI